MMFTSGLNREAKARSDYLSVYRMERAGGSDYPREASTPIGIFHHAIDWEAFTRAAIRDNRRVWGGSEAGKRDLVEARHALKVFRRLIQYMLDTRPWEAR